MAENSDGFRSVERPKTRENPTGPSNDGVKLTDVEETGSMADNASIDLRHTAAGTGHGRGGTRRSSRDCAKRGGGATGAPPGVRTSPQGSRESVNSDATPLPETVAVADDSAETTRIMKTNGDEENKANGTEGSESISNTPRDTVPDSSAEPDIRSKSDSTAFDETDAFTSSVFDDRTDYGSYEPATFGALVERLTGKFTASELKGDIERSDYPIPALKRLVDDVIACVLVYKEYSVASKKTLAALREQMRSVRTCIHQQVQQRHKQIMAVDPFLDLEEKQLRAEASKLHAEVAKISAELAQALKFSAETETSATEAAEAAVKAAQEANRIQQELEAKRRAEEKEAKALQREKELELEKLRAEKRRAEEEKKRLEKERKLRQKMTGRTPVWEAWPPQVIHVPQGDFDNGIGCLIRARGGGALNPTVDIQCQVLRQTDTNFVYNTNEELVSNIIRLKRKISDEENEKLKQTIYVAVPHCMTRASAISRETVVKAEYNGVWTELQTQEITYDHNKDMKFAQAGVDRLTRLAVVSRLKRDYHVIAGKSTKIVSAVDQRISLTCEKNTFNLPENLMLQIQPVDSNSLSDMKKRRPECSGLLNTSSIVKIQWEGKSDIKKPILVTIPVPPNPVKARKAAEMKKLKEARMKKPIVPTGIVEPEHERKKAAAAASRSNAAARKVQLQQQAAADEEDTEPVKPPTRWYMGQYATNDDDENDNLYLVTHDEKGYCQVVPGVKVTEIKMDVVQFMLAETLSQFTVVRTKTTVDDSEARQFASYIEDYLSQKVTKFVVKQRGDEPNSVAVECATLPKLDKTLERLEEEGFDDGPDVGPDIQLHEGDVVEVMFKGNVKNEDDSPLLFAFNSQLRSGVGFWATEASQYLQRQYPVFRGMIQMYKRTEEVKVVAPEPETVAMKAAAKKRMSLAEKKAQPADETEQQATTEDVQTADQVAPSDGEEQEDGPKYVTEVRHELLCQLMVNIPKDHIEPVHSIVKAPVVLLSNIKDPVDDEYLHHLAEELGDEWKKLAHYLGLRRVRVQAIICNINKNTGQRRSDEEAKYEMLTTWMKRLPRGANKVSILRKCLSRTGRRDLVEELLDVEKDFIADKKNRLTRRPSTKPPMLTRDTRTTIAAV